ncbi:amidohydrolase family protein [Pseudomonas sp. RA_15y_Pfl2_54]|uniref:amidohydrolase family protein n=1 Tax=Pseudomonas sp. RA_15y_Pfl2_54 TaxID=3088704 RepID=UPI0030D8472C
MLQRTLITNANLLTMAETAPISGLAEILVEDGRIAAIGTDLGISGVPIIDARGAIVMPGMIDTHRHVWQSLLRAQLGDGTLYDYMAKLRYGFAPHFTAEDAELGNYAGALDALNSGVTTVVDHSHLVATPDHADALLSGLEAAGIRAVFCYGLADVCDAGKPVDAARTFTTTWRHRDAERFRASRLSASDGLIRFGLGASEFLFAPLHFTEAEVRLARNLDAHRYSIHVANGPFARGTRYVTRMLSKGLVDDRTLFVHGNVLTKDDLSRIASLGATLSVTPESEMQMGMGTPVWPLARELGVPCGLGADIVSGGSGDIFTQIRLALAAGRMAANDRLGARRIMPERLALTAEAALRAVTIEGARVAGLENEVGSIEVGKKADLIFLRTDSTHMAPVLDPIKAVVMQASVADVDTVMVEGRVLKSNGSLVAVDQQALALRLHSAAQRIVSAVTTQDLKDAYDFVRLAFPLDASSALAARFAGWALRMPGLDKVVFNMMLAQSDSARRTTLKK